MNPRVIEKIEVADCWYWTAALDNHGYGRVWDGQRMKAAHRPVWEDLVGPIPEGLELDHLCRVRNCVNPDHLEPVTHKENSKRGAAGRSTPKQRCPQGHEYTEDNTYTSPRGVRHCRTCGRTRSRQWKADNRG